MKNKLFFAGLLIVAAVYWQWWVPGVKVANDFPFVSENVLKSLLDFPRTWSDRGSEGLGEVSSFFLWSYPLTFISGLLANLGLNFQAIERVVLIIPFLLIGSLSMWKMGESLKLSNQARLIMSIFYLANSYVLLLVDGGQLSIALAFAFFPLSFIALEKANEGGIETKIWAGLATATLGFFDFRFIYLLAIVSFIKFFFELRILAWFKIAVVSGVVTLGVNAYWLLPLLKFPISPQTYQVFTQTSFEGLGSLGHSLLLLSPHFPENIFGKITSLRWEFILIPAFALLAPILKPKNKTVLFWFFVLVLSIFLSKGATEPLAAFYPWLYNHLPGFSLFRDSSKFFTLEVLSYAVLWGIATDTLVDKLKNVRLKILFLSLLVFYLLFLIRPVWTDQMTGTFSNPRFQEEYAQLKDFLKSDNQTSRVFWMPSLPPLGYFDSEHPAVEASRLVQKRPFAAGVLGTYELFNFLREAPYMGEIFDVAGVGYIAYPPLDPKRDNLHPDNLKYYDTFQGQLSNLPWLSKVDSSIPLWQTKKHQGIFFETSDIWWVLGSDNIYNEATKSAKLSLSKNALIFAEEKAGLGKNLDQIPEAKIVLNDKTLLDLAAGFIEENNLIFPASYLKNDPDISSGWWKREAKDLISWRYFLRDKYQIDNLDFDLGGGWAVGEGNLKFEIRNLKLEKNKILLARVMESTRSGELKFYQGDSLINEVGTKKGGSNVRWFEVGTLRENELTIQSEGDINVINALAILDNDEWESYKNKANELRHRIVEFSKENTSTTYATVSYKRVNPTKYMVSVLNIKKPLFLVFSQSYNKLWKINGQSPLPVYSLLNGFRIEREGEYIMEFEPQKYVYWGLAISAFTLLITGIIIVCSKK